MRAAPVPFPSFHPIVEMGFFLCAIGLGVVLPSPPFVAVSLAAALAALCVVAGPGVGRRAAALIPLMVAIILINPLFLPLGDTVLFTYAGGRPYTVEALAAGAATAALLGAVLAWFAVFNRVMDSGKLLYLFGRVAPALAMALVLILRFVPSLGRRAREVAAARAGVGLGAGEGARRMVRLRDAGTVLTALGGWSLEHGVATADAMESRGYGTGRRTSVASRRLTAADGAALALLGLLTVCVIAASVQGAGNVAYFPQVALPLGDPLLVPALVCYAVLLFLPVLVEGGSWLQWRWSLSRS